MHTSAQVSSDSQPESVFHIIHREKGTSNYSFHKLSDPCPPFGMQRYPPHHFIARLREFPPSLSDTLIVSCTASGDVGLITRSEAPLSRDLPADKITNTYTMTTMADDSRRAQLPVSEEMMDTSPIGMALDLSSKDKVPKPIPSDEMDESPTPLPALTLLNHEGVLCVWWVVYNDSIRQKTAYPGLVAAGGVQSAPATAQSQPSVSPFASAASPSPQPSAFGATFSKPSAPAFGASSFSTPASMGAFGGPSALGANKSPWGSQAAGSNSLQTGGAAFGKPAFGAASTPVSKPVFGSSTPFGAVTGGSAFGAAGGLGNRSSPWGSAGASQTSTADAAKPVNPFGGTNAAAASPFANLGGGTSNAIASPFGSLGTNSAATASPFASLGQQSKPGQSPFTSLGQPTGTPSASFGMSTEPMFGSMATIDSGVGGSTLGSGQSLFGTPAVKSTPAQPATSVFGATVAAVPQSQEASMGDAEDPTSNNQAQPAPSAKPQSLFGLGSGGFQLGSTFKDTAKDTPGSDGDEPTPAKPSGSSFFGSGFDNALSDAKTAAPATPIKREPVMEEEPKLDDVSTTPASPPKAPAPPLAGGFVEGPMEPAPFFPPTKPAEPSKAKDASPPPESPSSASLPQSPKSPKVEQHSEDEEDIPALAGSPAIPVEVPESSSPLSPAADNEKGLVEGDAPLPPDPSSVKKPAWFNEPAPGAETHNVAPAPAPPTQPKASWSFLAPSKPQEKVESPSPPRSPARSPFAMSNTPAGFPKAPISFAPPTATAQSSPRSPSPVRSASTPAGRPLAVPPAKPISRPMSRPPPAPPSQPEVADLSDDEDERIREELASPVQPTKKLEPFIAHQDYAGTVKKDDIAGQIERLYRDMNSMLDTLGLNARALAAFIAGHSEGYDRERTRDDLDDDEDWCLVEIEDLSLIQADLERSLDDGRVSDLPSKLSDLSVLQRQTSRLRSRTMDLRRTLDAARDPSKLAALKAAPLSPDQSAQQAELRALFTAFTTRLAEAEDRVSLLKAKLASLPGRSGARPAQPTVEAVTTTILKMTAMIETKSADLDVLEAQVRRLRGASLESGMAALALGEAESREASPFVTPGSGRRGTYGLFYTPESSFRGSPARLGAVVNGGRLPRVVGVEEIERVNAMAAKRKAVFGRLREAVAKRGVRVTMGYE